ncbi:hypothetical protein ACFRU3_35970 [Streptomyces sp. NPDC056910]
MDRVVSEAGRSEKRRRLLYRERWPVLLKQGE